MKKMNRRRAGEEADLGLPRVELPGWLLSTYSRGQVCWAAEERDGPPCGRGALVSKLHSHYFDCFIFLRKFLS